MLLFISMSAPAQAFPVGKGMLARAPTSVAITQIGARSFSTRDPELLQRYAAARKEELEEESQKELRMTLPEYHEEMRKLKKQLSDNWDFGTSFTWGGMMVSHKVDLGMPRRHKVDLGRCIYTKNMAPKLCHERP